MWRPILNKLRFLIRPGQIDRDIAEEIDFHQKMLEAQHVEDGLTPEMTVPPVPIIRETTSRGRLV